MSDAALRVSGLSKQFTIGALQQMPTLKSAVSEWVSSAFRRSTQPSHIKHPTIWALRDVSFEIGYGEVLGIIGRNGSGKSTLLKILARVIPPTDGRAEVYGRLSALLEVGTGFHPDLTGRENVFLNGAILGMGRREIAQKFDDIVTFAEVEKFIDTPVKHYSSGMFVRLAFSVSTFLDADLLLVDEVLAVGDLAFQEKCMARMRDAQASGRTVILVSHSLAQIRNVCTQVLWLDGGRIHAFGDVNTVTTQYQREAAHLSVGAPLAEG